MILDDPDGDGKGAIDQIILTGTNTASRLAVVVKNKAGGDGAVDIGEVIGSGNLAAFTAAKQLGATTIGLSGGDGGKMRGHADVDFCLVAPSDSIHRVQETHVALYHILWDLTHTLLADARGPAPSTAGAPA